MDTFVCIRCGKTKPVNHDGGTGYATRVPGFDEEDRICYDCCGELDGNELRKMQPGEKTALYWDGKVITNWPGTLKITPTRSYKTVHHTPRSYWREYKTHIWFMFGGSWFYGYQIGQNTQIAHIRRIKNN